MGGRATGLRARIPTSISNTIEPHVRSKYKRPAVGYFAFFFPLDIQ